MCGKEEGLKKNITDTEEKRDSVVYYCKRCRYWHYEGSDIWYRHRYYSSQRPPRRVIRSKWRRLLGW